MTELQDLIHRKFTRSQPAQLWQIHTDQGWQPLTWVHETQPYPVWQILTDQGQSLTCADNHILINHQGQQVFARDLQPGDQLCSSQGQARVSEVRDLQHHTVMYDVSLAGHHQLYYANDLLSHNTTTAAGYLLWYAMFVPNSTILITAHKYIGAQEIMQRIRFAYENTPDFIRAGVVNYNRGSVEFENGSRIVSQTTTETTGRGMSISLLYCLGADTQVSVRDRNTGEILELSLSELAQRLDTDATRSASHQQ